MALKSPRWQSIFNDSRATIGGAENAGIYVAVSVRVNHKAYIVSLCTGFACKRSETAFSLHMLHDCCSSVFPPQHSLFHITHDCSCFCLSKGCTWELGICWFCTQMLLKSRSDIITRLRKRYWKRTPVEVLQECFGGRDGSNVFVKVCCQTYLHSYTNFNAGT